MNGITSREVMERAGWSRQDTFCKHYFIDKPTEQALVVEYGRSLSKQLGHVDVHLHSPHTTNSIQQAALAIPRWSDRKYIC